MRELLVHIYMRVIFLQVLQASRKMVGVLLIEQSGAQATRPTVRPTLWTVRPIVWRVKPTG